MRREARTFVKVARALTDAEPEFVSLVTAGANKTPFKAVRLEANGEGDEHMQVRQRQRHAAAALDPQPIHPLKESVVKAEGYEIAAIEFTKGDTFADEVAVKAWLDDGGYADYEIEAVDGGWSVRNKSVEFEGALRTVSSGKGYDVMVGKVKAAAETVEATTEDDQSEENAEKGCEGDGKKPKAKDDGVQPGAPEATETETEIAVAAKKFDGWYAQYYAEGNNFADAIEAGMGDGLPPGMYELTQALYGTISACVRAGDSAGVTKAANDYATVVNKFVDAVRTLDASEDATEAMKSEKRAKADKVIAAVLRAKTEETPVDAPEVEPTEKTAEQTTEEPAVKTDLEAVVGELKPMEIKEIDFGPAIKAAMEPVVGLIETLTKSVSALTEKVEKTEKSADARISQVEARVNAPARKGADVGDVSAAQVAPARTTDGDFLAELAVRSAIGSTHRRG